MNSVFASPYTEGVLLNPLVGALVFNESYKQKVSSISDEEKPSGIYFGVCIDHDEFSEINPILTKLVSTHEVLSSIINDVSNSSIVLSSSGNSY